MYSKEHELNFKDILRERRLTRDISWVSKTFHPKPAFIHEKQIINPLQFRYGVLMDTEIYSLFRKLFPDDSDSVIFHKINEILKEIGYSKNLTVIRCLGFVLLKIMKKTIQSIFVAENRLLKVKSNMGKNPVIFLPTHRSYADFILMCFLCFNYDIEIPVVVAGMDFHAMLGMATVLRQCGAMYMRRSFKDDKVYGAIFKKYVQNVVSYGNSPFEFFIEGTRSRCGKSLSPKLGLLKLVTDMYKCKDVQDFTLVPISISYDRVIEDCLLAREVLGIPKPKESTTGLLKGISLLEEQYGNVYINVGEEISLKGFMESHPTENYLPVLAHYIVNKQQTNIVITYFNVLSAVIVCLISEKCALLEVHNLHREVLNLRNLLFSLGATVSFKEDVTEELERVLSIHKFMQRNDVNGTISLNALQANEQVPYIVIQHYANAVYYFVVNLSFITLITKSNGNLLKESLVSKYKFFRRLFKYEFAFHEHFEQEDFEAAYSKLVALEILECDGDRSKVRDGESAYCRILCNILNPYLKGYLFACSCIVQVRQLEEKRLKWRIQKQLELHLEVSGDRSLVYCLSHHFLGCVISSLADEYVISQDRSSGMVTVMNRERLITVVNFLRNTLCDNMVYDLTYLKVPSDSVACKL